MIIFLHVNPIHIKYRKHQNTIKRAVSHFSSLLIQFAAGLESLGHMTQKMSKTLQLFCINIFMRSNSMTVPKAISSSSARGSGR